MGTEAHSTDTITYRKTCRCKGVTASTGPHIRVDDEPGLQMEVHAATGMACDRCGKPWRIVSPAPEKRRCRGGSVFEPHGGSDGMTKPELFEGYEPPTPHDLRVMAEWFDNPNESPHISVPTNPRDESTPGQLLRAIANELELAAPPNTGRERPDE